MVFLKIKNILSYKKKWKTTTLPTLVLAGFNGYKITNRHLDIHLFGLLQIRNDRSRVSKHSDCLAPPKRTL